MLLHLVVELFQIIFAPIGAMRIPRAAGMYPRVVAVKVLLVLLGRVILINQNRRVLPLVHRFADSAPVCVATFGKNENDRTTLVGNVRLMSGSIGPDVSA